MKQAPKKYEAKKDNWQDEYNGIVTAAEREGRAAMHRAALNGDFRHFRLYYKVGAMRLSAEDITGDDGWQAAGQELPLQTEYTRVWQWLYEKGRRLEVLDVTKLEAKP